MARSLAAYELTAAVLAGEACSPDLVALAFATPLERWRRALALEACDVQFGRALRRCAAVGAVPVLLDRELAGATAQAVRHAMRVPAQIAELSETARECGIRLIVLKGAARLLAGGVPGDRSLSDIDLLAIPSDARELHTALRTRLGYVAVPSAPEHHLPMLYRAGALPVEIHVRLGPQPTGLDGRIWRDTLHVPGTHVAIPSPTASVMHALEHAALVHWAVRYRLRDLVDVADAWSTNVDADEVLSYLRSHSQRVALTTMLGAARRFKDWIPVVGRSAWRTVRRVAYARHTLAAHIRSPELATSLCIAAGVLAEGSPRALWRPVQLALFGVRQATLA